MNHNHEEQTPRGTHKTPECDGNWIDISTLSRKRVMYLKCRATVEGLSDPDAVPKSAPAGFVEEDTAPKESREAWRPSPYATLTFLFAVVAMVAFLVGLLVGAQAGP